MKRESEASLKPVKPATELFKMSLEIEELEPIVAPGLWQNSNETLVTDSELNSEVEELEQILAPQLAANSNETLVRDFED